MGVPVVADEQVEQRAMSLAIARAIADAEVALNARPAEALAQEAYTNLCFDFPLITSPGLAALADAFRNAYQRKSLSSPFPLTAPFIAGLCYVAYSASATGDLQSAQRAGNNNPSDDFSEEATRQKHIHTIVGCILLQLPVSCLAHAADDGGAALRSLLSPYSILLRHVEPSTAELDSAHRSLALGEDQLASHDDETNRHSQEIEIAEGEGRELTRDSAENSHEYLTTSVALLGDMDDDGSDWEPLEGSPHHHRPLSTDLTNTGGEMGDDASWPTMLAKLADLAGHLRYEALSTPGVWEDLKLTDGILLCLRNLFRVADTEALGEHGDRQVGVILRAYLEILCDRLLDCPSGGREGNSDSLAKSVSRSLEALGVTDWEKPGVQEERSRAGLLLLSSLCSRLPAMGASGKGGAMAGGKVRGVMTDSRKEREAKRQLWREIEVALTWLGARLAVLATQSPWDTDWAAELERVLNVLIFYVQAAPSNARLGTPLLESGVCRAAAALFIAAGEVPLLESLRVFMLLSAGLAVEVAKFVAAIAAFRAKVSDSAFVNRQSFLAPHGLLWPLVLPSPANSGPAIGPGVDAAPGINGGEDRLLQLVKEITRDLQLELLDSVTGKMSLLQRALALLQEVADVSATSAKKILMAGSGVLDAALAQCELAIRDTLSRQMAEASASTTNANLAARDQSALPALENPRKLHLKPAMYVEEGDEKLPEEPPASTKDDTWAGRAADALLQAPEVGGDIVKSEMPVMAEHMQNELQLPNSEGDQELDSTDVKKQLARARSSLGQGGEDDADVGRQKLRDVLRQALLQLKRLKGQAHD